MLFDYETLKLICWVVVGLLLIGFVVINGIDMGAGILLPFMAKSDTDRWVIVAAFGPHRTGPRRRSNQIWLVAAGVAIFAAWPPVLVITYRALSVALLVAFAVYFLRPIGRVYRNKLEATPRGAFWDWEIFVGSVVPPLVFGVIFGNLLVGLPYRMDEFLQVNYAGSIWALLNPLALLFGSVLVAMVVTQGATWLQFKTSGYIYERARIATVIAALASSLTLFSAGWVVFWLDGYVITELVDAGGQPNPLIKSVQLQEGAWLGNFKAIPLFWLLPALGVSLPWLTVFLTRKHYGGSALLSSSLTLAITIFTAGIVLFPFIVPSSLNPSQSLTVWDATSDAETLNMMMWLAIVFFSVVLSYAIWRYVRMFAHNREREVRVKQYSLN